MDEQTSRNQTTTDLRGGEPPFIIMINIQIYDLLTNGVGFISFLRTNYILTPPQMFGVILKR